VRGRRTHDGSGTAAVAGVAARSPDPVLTRNSTHADSPASRRTNARVWSLRRKPPGERLSS
jgi:hypothetical protein